MAYPRRLLGDGETVALDLHPHWRVLVWPALALPVIVAATAYLAAVIPSGSHQALWRTVVAGAGLVALAVCCLRPFLRWVTTRYVVTSDRVIMRSGVLARSGRDLPLHRLNDVSFSHGLLERMLGAGTLVLESGGERGQVTLADVPHVEAVQRTVYRLAEQAERRWGPGGGAPDGPAGGRDGSDTPEGHPGW